MEAEEELKDEAKTILEERSIKDRTGIEAGVVAAGGEGEPRDEVPAGIHEIRGTRTAHVGEIVPVRPQKIAGVEVVRAYAGKSADVQGDPRRLRQAFMNLINIITSGHVH